MQGLLGNLLICDSICLEALAYSPTEGQTQRLGRWEADASWQSYCIQLRVLSEEAGKRGPQGVQCQEWKSTNKGQNNNPALSLSELKNLKCGLNVEEFATDVDGGKGNGETMITKCF